MNQIERIASGIPGLDKLMEGGFVKGSTNLVAGCAGTCKTIFGCQYIWHGLQKGQNGVYITLEERPEDIIADVSGFGWDFKRFIDANKCLIEWVPPSDITQVAEYIRNCIKRIDATRIVLDSVSLVAMGWKERPEELFKSRIKIFELIKSLKSLGVTSLIISEIPKTKGSGMSWFGFEEFVADGVVLLQLLTVDKPMRSIQVLKMRRTNHSMEAFPFKITKDGIIVRTE